TNARIILSEREEFGDRGVVTVRRELGDAIDNRAILVSHRLADSPGHAERLPRQQLDLLQRRDIEREVADGVPVAPPLGDPTRTAVDGAGVDLPPYVARDEEAITRDIERVEVGFHNVALQRVELSVDLAPPRGGCVPVLADPVVDVFARLEVRGEAASR